MSDIHHHEEQGRFESVRPVCSYAVSYLARHPEYQDLAA